MRISSDILVIPNDNEHISSDHFSITFQLSYIRSESPSKVIQYVYDYSKADFSSMNIYILSSNIFNCLYTSDVETAWAIIKSVVYEAMTLLIPKFQLRSKQYPKWFTKDLRHWLKCLHTLRRICKRSPTNHNTE